MAKICPNCARMAPCFCPRCATPLTPELEALLRAAVSLPVEDARVHYLIARPRESAAVVDAARAFKDSPAGRDFAKNGGCDG